MRLPFTKRPATAGDRPADSVRPAPTLRPPRADRPVPIASDAATGDGPHRRTEPAEPDKRARPATAAAPSAASPARPGRTAPAALTSRPFIRLGVYGWSFIGLLLVVLALGVAVSQLRIVVIPLLLALFPAAVLAPPTGYLKRYLPDSLAALVVLLSFIGIISGLVTAFADTVTEELSGLADQVRAGADQVRSFLEGGPFGLAPVSLDTLISQASDQVQGSPDIAGSALGAATVLVEGVTGLIFGLFALFFYLKDGPRIALWMRSLFPNRFQADAEAIGLRTWQTIGAYIRGQLIIALVDATAIGIFLAVVGVPLALPLSVLVFFGALFPIVGAFISGGVAVLVALATNGVGSALLVLAAIVVIQQVEGHLLQPVVLGRATELHPLATVAALASGAALLGVLGAFISIPIAASGARTVAYLRERTPG